MAAEDICGRLWFLLKTIGVARSCSHSFICRFLEGSAMQRGCFRVQKSALLQMKDSLTPLFISFLFFFLFLHKLLVFVFIVWSALLMEFLCRWWLKGVDASLLLQFRLNSLFGISSTSSNGSGFRVFCGLGKPICFCLVESCLLQPKGQICWLQYKCSHKTMMVADYRLFFLSRLGLFSPTLKESVAEVAATSLFCSFALFHPSSAPTGWFKMAPLKHFGLSVAPLKPSMGLCHPWWINHPISASTAGEADPLTSACSRIPRGPKTQSVIGSADIKCLKQSKAEMEERLRWTRLCAKPVHKLIVIIPLKSSHWVYSTLLNIHEASAYQRGCSWTASD